MKLEDIKEAKKFLLPNRAETADRMRVIALDIKEIIPDVALLKPHSFYSECLKGIAVSMYDVAEKLEGLVHCDICGDFHDVDSIPLSCQTGDGE